MQGNIIHSVYIIYFSNGNGGRVNVSSVGVNSWEWRTRRQSQQPETAEVLTLAALVSKAGNGGHDVRVNSWEQRTC